MIKGHEPTIRTVPGMPVRILTPCWERAVASGQARPSLDGTCPITVRTLERARFENNHECVFFVSAEEIPLDESNPRPSSI